MQEVQQPYAFDVPIEGFRKLYPRWAHAKFGLIVTGQIQIDIRHLSTTADVVIHEGSLDEPIFAHWKEWAALAQAGGTPCLAQLAHPGKRGSAAARRVWGAIPAQAPSAVPIKFPPGWFNQIAGNYLYGEVAEMTVAEIDSVVEKFVFGAKVCQKAGFAGVGIHSSHGFLLSQFLSPASNQRTDDYGGSPEKRRYILARIVKAIRDECGPKFCIAVKLNSADFSEGGLSEDEAIEHVRWLCECDLVDFVGDHVLDRFSIDQSRSKSLEGMGRARRVHSTHQWHRPPYIHPRPLERLQQNENLISRASGNVFMRKSRIPFLFNSVAGSAHAKEWHLSYRLEFAISLALEEL